MTTRPGWVEVPLTAEMLRAAERAAESTTTESFAAMFSRCYHAALAARPVAEAEPGCQVCEDDPKRCECERLEPATPAVAQPGEGRTEPDRLVVARALARFWGNDIDSPTFKWTNRAMYLGAADAAIAAIDHLERQPSASAELDYEALGRVAYEAKASASGIASGWDDFHPKYRALWSAVAQAIANAVTRGK